MSDGLTSTSTAGRPIHCKAAVVWQPGGKHQIETVIVAAPRQNQVRVKIMYTGICHTDVTISEFKALAPAFPAIFGHEATGIVESVGEGTTNVQVGDHVLLFIQGQCNECTACRLKRSNWCPARPLAMLSPYPVGDDKPTVTTEDGKGIHVATGIGSFSEYVVMHKDFVVTIDPKAPLDTVCVLSCGVATGIGAAWNAAKVEPGASVAVIGLGTIGLAVVQACKIAGASRIIGVDINPSKMDAGKVFGMTDFINPNEIDQPISKAIMDMTGGGVKYSFECVGIPKLMSEAVECTAQGYSMTIILGLTTDLTEQFGITAVPFLFGKNVCSVTMGGYRCRELPTLVDKYMRKELQLEQFITHRRPLADINEGMKDFASGNCLRCVLQVG